MTFTPGQHYWSASVQRLRFGVDELADGVAEIRGLVADRGRIAAAWTVGPSATPAGLLARLLAMGMQGQSDEGSLMLVLTAPPHIQAPPFVVRLVTSYEDHRPAIVVANQGFAFPSEDALAERRGARASFQSEQAGGHSVRLRGELERLASENQRLQARVRELTSQVEQLRRAAKRQAAPFSKDRPTRNPRRPGRKPGAAYGWQGRRPVPERVDRVVAVGLSGACPYCGADTVVSSVHISGR